MGKDHYNPSIPIRATTGCTTPVFRLTVTIHKMTL